MKDTPLKIAERDAGNTAHLIDRKGCAMADPFINERVRKLVERLPQTMSARQMEKLLERAAQEPEWFLQSESCKTFQADEKLKETLHRRLMNKRQMKGSDRNSPCPCGSGKKFKKCHGR